MDKLAPIILFVYNRPKHTQLTLDSLKQNNLASKSEIYVFSDGPKNNDDKIKIDDVRKIVSQIEGFKSVTIYKSETNKGLANSVIEGVNKIFETYENAIILEDDLIFSKDFLEFMNSCLNFYKVNKSIKSISGYTYPIQIPKYYKSELFLLYRASSWGWATWKDRWEKVDWEVKDFNSFKNDRIKQREFNRGGEDLTPMLKKQELGELDSWAIKWGYNHFIGNTYCLYPVKSKVNNIGMDKSGRHSRNTKKYFTKVYEGIPKFEKDLRIDPEISAIMKKFFSLSLYRKMINKIKYGI